VKTVSEILSAAADLIEPEGKWTQGYYARDQFGSDCEPEDSCAVCWCTIGAIERASEESVSDDCEAYNAAEQAVAAALPGITIVSWNDAPERTQADVVAKLREAAERAREQGL
jgi:hypothetical protein